MMIDVLAFILLLSWWVSRDGMERNIRIGPGLEPISF